MPPSILHRVPSADFFRNELLQRLRITPEQRKQIQDTPQHDPGWYAARHFRVTMSNAATAADNNPFETADSLVLSMLEPLGEDVLNAVPLPPTLVNRKKRNDKAAQEAMRHGTMYEDVAREAYTIRMENRGHKVDVWECGLCVDLETGWLGASPDGFVRLDDREDVGLLEIKCPKAGVVYEKMPCYYYDQIQGLMNLLDLNWCHFIVWTKSDICIWEFLRDVPYWTQKLKPRLEKFYFEKFIPAYCEHKRVEWLLANMDKYDTDNGTYGAAAAAAAATATAATAPLDDDSTTVADGESTPTTTTTTTTATTLSLDSDTDVDLDVDLEEEECIIVI